MSNAVLWQDMNIFDENLCALMLVIFEKVCDLKFMKKSFEFFYNPHLI